MSAFETFIQLELPKRPFLQSDVSQETVMVRRGPGPRQLGSATLVDGEVLAMVNGVLVGSTVELLSGIRKLVVHTSTPSAIWNVIHGLNSSDVIIQVTDDSGYVLIPDETQIVSPNSVQVLFNTAQSGYIRMLFLN